MADADALHPEFADLWPDSRGRVDARLADLDRGVSALEQGTLAEEDIADQLKEAYNRADPQGWRAVRPGRGALRLRRSSR